MHKSKQVLEIQHVNCSNEPIKNKLLLNKRKTYLKLIIKNK